MASNYEQSDTGNWNIAENWSNAMIFKPFYECSEYLTIAKFGVSNITEEFELDDKIKSLARIKALKWAKEKLEQGIRQCLFAIRSKNDSDKVKGFLKEIRELTEINPDFNNQSIMQMVENKLTFRDSYKIEINEDYFDIVYNILQRIFTEVTEPMNKNDLIFTHKETFDPSEYKRRLKERFVEGG